MGVPQRRRRGARRARRCRAGDRPAQGGARLRVLQRPIGDRAAHGEPRRRRAGLTPGARLDAVRYRDSIGIDATAYRVVHGEADRFPGLVVDRYGDFVVLQALVQSVDRMVPEITHLLAERLRPTGILARNDPRVRLLEGLEQRVDVLFGEVPARVAVREGRVEYDVDLRRAEDRVVPRSAREPRGGRVLCRRPRPRRSATTADSRWRWRRSATKSLPSISRRRPSRGLRRTSSATTSSTSARWP